ncbi:Tyrosine--tRNA ligase, mitochondrial [Aphelenchoides fujianensis]|nr:Tyrosine--tRNA ligase, mitochondrial [Aphelenchoides fujianensis]
MVRLRSRAFGSEQNVLRFCKELARRNLISASHPHELLASNNAHIVRNLPGNGVYAGFDPTANSLHVGNLLIISNLLRSSLFGCDPIALIGGATALIGDPTGRSGDRPELTRHFVGENSKNIVRQLAEIVENGRDPVRRPRPTHDPQQRRVMNMVDFLRIGRGFRVGEMLRLGPIRARMEGGGLSFTEFSYQILQSYDWYFLSRNHDCYFQLGGSDQLGHLDSGADYIKRQCGIQSIGVSLPLLSDEKGGKLGKSTAKEGAPVWLDGAKTSPFALFQYFRQVHDDVAETLLTYFSLRPFEDVEAILAHHRENLGKWIAQQALAEEMVALIHGRTAVEKAIQCSNVLFNGLRESRPRHDLKIFAGPLTFQLSKREVATVADLAEATRTKGAQLVPQGAFRLNGAKITDPAVPLDHSSLLLKSRYSLVGWGKRKTLMPHSRLQLRVLLVYKRLLRAATKTADPADSTAAIRLTFKRNSREITRTNFQFIEQQLRTAERRLAQMERGEIERISTVSIRRADD